MSGIYLHIPYCKQACHYCDFHFSTTTKGKEDLIQAMRQEIILRKDYLDNHPVETIYFGGGTPSILSISELESLLETIAKNFSIASYPEITLEANPDDLNLEKLNALKSIGINRLSVGIQSFHDNELIMMNRAHQAKDALRCLDQISQLFDNYSIDLIYGMPESTTKTWEENLKMLSAFSIPHLSSYALTVEPKTALQHFVNQGVITLLEEEKVQEQFELLVDFAEENHFIHYELSNFGKEGYFSKNNTAYWLGKSYLGIGPAAHSFNQTERSWNVSNNPQYTKAIQKNTLDIETETLTKKDRFNEYIMTGLRTMWGVSYEKIALEFGERYVTYLKQSAQKHLENHLLYEDNQTLRTTRKGKFLSDGIASDLFWIKI